MRITFDHVLGFQASGMSITEIIDDFPELTEEDIRACLEFTTDHNQLRYNYKLDRLQPYQ